MHRYFTPVKETTFMIKAQNDIRHQINRWIDSDSNEDNTQLAIPKTRICNQQYTDEYD